MKAENNLRAFKALIKKYRSIKLEQLEKAWALSNEGEASCVLKSLTGFSTSFCTLCIAADVVKKQLSDSNGYRCEYCMYVILGRDKRGPEGCPCVRNKHGETYYKISNSQNPNQLLQAIKERADYMESLLLKYEK